MKILCTGDLHMGRRPSKVADAHEARRYSATSMWESIVEKALAESVDLVVLTGDIVDAENGYFEAIGPLERGLLRLAEAGIATYAVSGNHDWDVFVRLSDSICCEAFHLLGRGGEWETAYYPDERAPRLRLVGWSFPGREMTSDPLASLPPLRDDQVPTIGLLHGDLDQPTSRYAPLSQAALVRQPVAAWLLGHVHRPTWLPSTTGAGILYPGSPQALDPGETGGHGPWLLELNELGEITARHILLSKVRYDALRVDLEGVESRGAFEAKLVSALRGHVDAIEDGGALALLSLRVRMVGRTPMHRELHEYAAELIDEFDLTVRGITCRIEQVVNATRPAMDIDELAVAHSLPGRVARLIRQMECGVADDAVRELIDRATEKLVVEHRGSTFKDLGKDREPTREDAQQLLLEESYALLDALLCQKEPA